MMEFIAKLIEWLKVPPKVMVSLLLLAIFCLFTPDRFVEMLGISDFVTTNRSSFGAVFLVSSISLLTYPISSIYAWLLEVFEEKLHRSKVKEHLLTLTSDEKHRLRFYLNGDSRTKYFGAEDGAVASLAKANILYLASPLGRRSLGGYPYNIYPWIFGYLKQNTNLIKQNA